MYSPNVQILQIVILEHRSGQNVQLPRPGESFYTEVIFILGLLLAAFTPLIQLTPPSQSLHAFKLSTYCTMMMLCAATLVADVNLKRRGRLNFHTRRWSLILRTISILSGSLAIISLLSTIKPYVALVSLLVWLLFAAYLTCSLIQDLNPPLILPVNVNRVPNFTSMISESINTVFGMLQNWAINLFQRGTRAILVIHRRNIFDRHISGTARGMVQLPV